MVNINSLERDGLRQAEHCPRHTMMTEKKGRQKKRWEDNNKEWTGMDFTSSTGRLKTGQDEKGLLRTRLW